MDQPVWTELAHGLYLEGLAVDHARELVWYSDVSAGGVRGVRFDGTEVALLNPDRMWTGGIMLNSDGSVLSTGQHGIMWNHPERATSGWLLDAMDGKPLDGINEMAPDGEGGLFVGTIDMEAIIAGREAAPARLCHLSRTRAVRVVWEEFGFANGLMYDAQRRRLYVNATFDGTYAFDVAADFTLSNRRRILDKFDADGMALDAEGNVWITGFTSNFLERLTPDGEALERVPVPPGSVTQVRFGGFDGCDVFITSVPLDGGDTLKEGGAITVANSRLYHARLDTPGWRIPPADFRL